MTRTEYIMMSLDNIIEDATKARAKFLDRTNDANEFIYALQWAESAALDNAKGAIAENLRAYINAGNKVADALVMAHRELTRQLLRDQFRGTSSSQFHNATEHQQRAAASSMLEKVESWIDTLEREDD